MNELERETASFDDFHVVLALSYGAREDIIAAIDPEVEKPEEVQLMNMSELSGVTDTNLVYPLSWEIIEYDMIVSPIIRDWNGFEIGFSINEEIPTVMVNDVEYRVSDIPLGKGNYTIEFR